MAAPRDDEVPSPADAPSPHARFPWAPALFCAACLAMAAWTWMRYSYCWDILVKDLPAALSGIDPDPLSGMPPPAMDPDQVRKELSRYVWPEALGDHWLRERCVGLVGRVVSVPFSSYVIDDDGTNLCPQSVHVSDGTGVLNVLVFPSDMCPLSVGDHWRFRGRLVLNKWWWMDNSDINALALDTSAGRWHAASVGGLVVGAMGLFVFGLYLRSWLRGRKLPAASQ